MTIRCFLMVAACLSCVGCRAANPSSPEASASSAVPSAARGHAQSPAVRAVVYAYYFHQTFRCLSCQMTEELAARTIQEHLAQPIRDGQVVWMSVNMDEPEGKVLRHQFKAQASDLVLALMEDGVCKKSKKLDELAELSDRPDAFSKHLVNEIVAYLSPTQGG